MKRMNKWNYTDRLDCSNIDWLQTVVLQNFLRAYIGYVTQFMMPDDYISHFEVKVVGDHFCQELWIPAAELENFNQHIQGKIEVVKVFKGENFNEDGQLPEYMYKNDAGISEWWWF